MSRLKQLTAKELIRFLKANGFREDRQAGSHLTLKNNERNLTLIIPVHTGCDIGRGLILRILRDAGLTRKQLIDFK